MSKNDLRAFFIDIKPIIKINYYLKACKISQSNFSHYINDNRDDCISYDRLLDLYSLIVNDVAQKIA